MNPKANSEPQHFAKGDVVYHNDRRGVVRSYFNHYCADPTKAVVDDGDGWNIGYQVVPVSKLRRNA